MHYTNLAWAACRFMRIGTSHGRACSNKGESKEKVERYLHELDKRKSFIN